MKLPQVSVIIPVYKAELYLDECIQSILSQTFTDFELLLIDDGSPDSSGQICDYYAGVDSRICVIHKQNEGVSAARNTGIEKARGKYISFVDSDDTVDENFLENAVLGIQSNDVDIYISGLWMETWRNGTILDTVQYGIQKTQVYSVKELLENLNCTYQQICICGPWCKLYKRATIQEYGIRFSRQLNYGEDTYFNLDVLKKSKTVYFSQDCFYHYRRASEESLFSRFHRDTYEVHQMIYSKMRSLMQLCSCNDEAMRRFEGLYFSLMVGGIHEYYKYKQLTTKSERLAQIKKVGNDEFFVKSDMKNLHGRTNKVLYMLLRAKLYILIAFIFEIKYQRC